MKIALSTSKILGSQRWTTVFWAVKQNPCWCQKRFTELFSFFFIKIFVFPLLLVTFLIIIGRVPAIFENTGIDFQYISLLIYLLYLKLNAERQQILISTRVTFLIVLAHGAAYAIGIRAYFLNFYGRLENNIVSVVVAT